ncbi:MAG: SHOCT domain-containing protein [Oscillospiraceae bacterium]
MDGEIIGYIFAVIIFSVMFGAVTCVLNNEKGYEGGFWWGFFLGVIGIIIVVCKPENKEVLDRRCIIAGGWVCKKCGKRNNGSVMTCECGSNKLFDTHVSADELIKYKKLLDDGAITESEYNNVKKKLLNF